MRPSDAWTLDPDFWMKPPRRPSTLPIARPLPTPLGDSVKLDRVLHRNHCVVHFDASCVLPAVGSCIVTSLHTIQERDRARQVDQARRRYQEFNAFECILAPFSLVSVL